MSLVFQDDNLTSRRVGATSVWDSGVGGLSSLSEIATQLEGKKKQSIHSDSNMNH